MASIDVNTALPASLPRLRQSRGAATRALAARLRAAAKAGSAAPPPARDPSPRTAQAQTPRPVGGTATQAQKSPARAVATPERDTYSAQAPADPRFGAVGATALGGGAILSLAALQQVAHNPQAGPALPPPTSAPPSDGQLQQILKKASGGSNAAMAAFSRGGSFNWTAFTYFINAQRLAHMFQVMLEQQQVAQAALRLSNTSNLTSAILTKESVNLERANALMSLGSTLVQVETNVETAGKRRLSNIPAIIPMNLLDVWQGSQSNAHRAPLAAAMRREALRVLGGGYGEPRPLYSDGRERKENDIYKTGDEATYAHRRNPKDPTILLEAFPGGPEVRRYFLAPDEVHRLTPEEQTQYEKMIAAFKATRLDDNGGKVGELFDEDARLGEAARQADEAARVVEAPRTAAERQRRDELLAAAQKRGIGNAAEFIEATRNHAAMARANQAGIAPLLAGASADLAMTMRIIGPGRRGFQELAQEVQGMRDMGVNRLRKERAEMEKELRITVQHKDSKHADKLRGQLEMNKKTELDLMRRIQVLYHAMAAYRGDPNNQMVSHRLNFLQEARDRIVKAQAISEAAKTVQPDGTAGGSLSGLSPAQVVHAIDSLQADRHLPAPEHWADARRELEDEIAELKQEASKRKGAVSDRGKRFDTAHAQVAFAEMADRYQQARKGETAVQGPGHDAYAVQTARKKVVIARDALEEFRVVSPPHQWQLCELTLAYQRAEAEQGQKAMTPAALERALGELHAQGVVQHTTLAAYDEVTSTTMQRHLRDLQSAARDGGWLQRKYLDPKAAEVTFWKQAYDELMAANPARKAHKPTLTLKRGGAVLRPAAVGNAGIPSRFDAEPVRAGSGDAVGRERVDLLDEDAMFDHHTATYDAAVGAMAGFDDKSYQTQNLLYNGVQQFNVDAVVQATAEQPQNAAMGTGSLADGAMQEADATFRNLYGQIEQMYQRASSAVLKPQFF